MLVGLGAMNSKINLRQLHRVNSAVFPTEIKCSDGIPTVGILLSIYNGAAYLAEQIASIDAQIGVRVVMFCRDDGSSDGSAALLKTLSETSHGAISEWHLLNGENLGFYSSFELLVKSANGCDFYAFSDQDDVWKENKLISAISCLEHASGGALYASAVQTVGERLELLGVNSFPGFVYSIPSEFIRHRLAGHTMLWNNALQDAVSVYSCLPCWSHDQQVVVSALLSGAELFLDDEPYVYHRRLDSSVTPGGSGLYKRVCHEANLVINSNKSINRAGLASAILALGNVVLSDTERYFLEICAEGRFKNLLSSNVLDCGLFLGNLEARLSILLGRF